MLEACRRCIVKYAGDDTEGRVLLADLDARATRYSKDVTSLARKTDYFDTIATLRIRATMPGPLGQ